MKLSSLCALLLLAAGALAQTIQPSLPGTRTLDLPKDWREQQRQQIIRYYELRVAAAGTIRDRKWQPDFSSEEAYRKSVQPHRARLRAMLGLRGYEPGKAEVRKLAPGVEEVRFTLDGGWPVRALIFAPTQPSGAAVIAIPPETYTAEAFARTPWVTSLISSGTLVAIPTTVTRSTDHPLSKKLRGRDLRNILHRYAFITGRTLTGLEVEQASALRQYFASRSGVQAARISVLGGMSALFAAASDQRFASATILGYFDAHAKPQEEPFDRMIYGRMNEFGDAELAALIAPRPLTLSYGPGSSGTKEFDRAQRFYKGLKLSDRLRSASPPPEGGAPAYKLPETEIRQARDEQFDGMHRYLRQKIGEADRAREERWELASTPASLRAARTAELRKELAALEGIPHAPPMPLNPRTRLLKVTQNFVAYETMLGVLDGVDVYGHLLIPRKPGARLPAVVCQHGLEGQPKDTNGLGEKPDEVYHAFAARLADRGYVVFSPYLTVPVPQDNLINPIVRLAGAVGGMRTGMEVRKLRRVVDFLSALPFVDPARIGYYGLSYGGYSAIWMGSMEPRLKAIIISGHFNHWLQKITNEELATSYMMYADEDFYNWNVINRFSHTELIAAMWPRAVMVEWADNDGTTNPEWHGRAWKEVAALAAAWGVEDKIVREPFLGKHEIGGMGSFEFLDRWLRPELPPAREYVYAPWPRRELPGLGDRSGDTWPCLYARLDANPDTFLRSTFRVLPGAPLFKGISVQLSRSGNPGPLLLRFGTKEGTADLGEARISGVHPLYDLWYDAPVAARRLVPGRLYYVEMRAEATPSAEDYYQVWGPKPLGGKARPHNFGFSYRLIGHRRAGEDTHEFVKRYLDLEVPAKLPASAAARPGEVRVTPGWSIEVVGDDEVTMAAAADLKEFLDKAFGLRLGSRGKRTIRLESAPSGRDEGFELRASNDGIAIRGNSPRGLLRGVYWLEESFQERQAPALPPGATTRNSRMVRRITTSILPGGERFDEASRPLLYTDGLLKKISKDGFNGIWIWMNTEEAAFDSKIFPELDDKYARTRLARVEDVARRARRYGIDVWLYLATGYHEWTPEWFYKKHPEVRGVGWGRPMCTSDPRVPHYHAEIVRNIFTEAPSTHGLVVIYDSEGFFYCGNTDHNRERCPRCRKSTCVALAHDLLTNLNGAMKAAGGPHKEFIAWNYGDQPTWIRKLIPSLPKDMLFQVDFSKGGLVERDGIRHYTGDYNLTLVGPPDHFVEQYKAAKASGLPFIAKTEHAISQEFIFVPYIPAMEQWARRILKIREFDVQGWFGNWCHYGYMAPLPAQLINAMSFDPAPSKDEVLAQLARRNYGAQGARAVLKAWDHFSDGIRLFPYSDNVSRIPGPLQKGSSHPFLLDPKIGGFGSWRSWQNDLNWTKPWGPRVASKYLRMVKAEFTKGIASLDDARRSSVEPYREMISAEWRLARTIEASLDTVLNLIDWIEARDRFYRARDAEARAAEARSLEKILLTERANALKILPVLEQDSRLGYASEGGGVVRSGLFTPELVRWKIGQIDDVLTRELPALTGRAPAAVPTSLRGVAAAGGAR